MTKLTLSVDRQVVEQAKRIARREHTSVSAMFTNMVRVMASSLEVESEIPKESLTSRMTGAIRLPPDKTADDLRYEALCEKHGITSR